MLYPFVIELGKRIPFNLQVHILFVIFIHLFVFLIL